MIRRLCQANLARWSHARPPRLSRLLAGKAPRPLPYLRPVELTAARLNHLYASTAFRRAWDEAKPLRVEFGESHPVT